MATAVQLIPVKITAKQSRWARKNGIEWAQFTRSSAARSIWSGRGVRSVVVGIDSPYLLVGRLNPSSGKSPLTRWFWQHPAMTDFATLSVAEAAGVVTVTLDHPPVNLLDAPMLGDLARLVGELEGSETARVVVLRSADPEFFVAHADLHLIAALPRDERPYPTTLEFFHALMERWRTLPLVTIAQV